MFDVGTIDFALYEDSTEFMGIASFKIPDRNRKTITINGAGIGGDVEIPIPGHYDAMVADITLRADGEKLAKLREPRRHQLELRVAQSNEDPVAGALITAGFKYVLIGVPKSSSGGTIAPATSGDTTVSMAVRYLATYMDGKKIEEIDQLNRIDIVNGVDYNADVRKALGK